MIRSMSGTIDAVGNEMMFLREWIREWCLGLDEYQGRAVRRHQIFIVRETYYKTNSAKITGCLWGWCLCSFQYLVVDSCFQNWSEIDCRRPAIWETLSRPWWHSNSLIMKRQSVIFSLNSCSGVLHSSKHGAATFT
jgi:hypothetical protein